MNAAKSRVAASATTASAASDSPAASKNVKGRYRLSSQADNDAVRTSAVATTTNHQSARCRNDNDRHCCDSSNSTHTGSSGGQHHVQAALVPEVQLAAHAAQASGDAEFGVAR